MLVGESVVCFDSWGWILACWTTRARQIAWHIGVANTMLWNGASLIGSRCQCQKRVGPEGFGEDAEGKELITFSRRSCRLHGGCFGVWMYAIRDAKATPNVAGSLGSTLPIRE